ncbi:MAG: class I mannose-6-phosphate isomerase [Flavobacteriaceae bacterium]|nr:class I mannose-6-phosphate isomerase [Flavobacteriaceae bacterium]
MRPHVILSFILNKINTPPLYPLSFEPILKEKVWGGDLLHSKYQKKAKGNIGESWELSGVPNNVSVVKNGALKSKSLKDLIEMYGSDLLGKKVFKTYKTTFPLLFKYIDASQDLSVQVHPDDELASSRHGSFGKTEMWYVMHAEADARLILGFEQPMTKEVYQRALENFNLTSILKSQQVEKGDAFFIAPGTVHAIGAGVLLAEIQQTSDITYRIYDWDRPDSNGEMRELHTEEAAAAIDFRATNAQIDYEAKDNKPVRLKQTPFFETNILKVNSFVERDLREKDSFIVYMCTEGSATIHAENTIESIDQGQTLLIPASIARVDIESESATILEVYIP